MEDVELRFVWKVVNPCGISLCKVYTL